jgi:uncharacterized protein involved in outer membrane biogenesis
MQFRRKPLLWIAALLSCLLLFLIFLLPGIIRNKAVAEIEKATGRKASIAAVSLNPFTLSAGVTGFRLAEKGSAATFLSFSSARVTISPASLVKRALVISGVQIAAPYVNLVRSAPNTYNFSDLLTPRKKEEPANKFLFSLNNVEIRNGGVDFHDQAAAKPTSHTVRQLSLALPFISNIPYLADRYVAPHFAALVNGAPLEAKGRLKPLTKSVEASLSLHVKDLDLPFYYAYLPVTAPVKIRSGRLSTALELSYCCYANKKPDLIISGNLNLVALSLLDRQGASLLALDRAALAINRANLTSRELDLASLALDGTKLYIDRDAKGNWNLQKLFAANHAAVAQERQATPPPKAVADQPKSQVKLASLRFRGGTLHVADQLPAGGFTAELTDINLALDGFSTAAGQQTRWGLDFHSAREEKASLKGEFSVEPLTAKAELAVAGIPLGAYYPYLQKQLAAPITGNLAVAGNVAYSQETGLVVEKVALDGRQLAAAFTAAEGVKIASLAINGAGFRQKDMSAVFDQIVLNGVDCRLSREADGSFSPQRLLRKQETAAPAVKPAAKSAVAGKPFNYRVNKIAGSGVDIAFTDRMKKENPAFTFRKARFTLANITGPSQGAIPFTLATAFAKEGRVTAVGSVTPSPLKLKGNLTLERISLREFDPYLPENLNVYVADGFIDTRLAFNLAKKGADLAGTFSGGLGVRSFYCLDTVESEDLLKWESLQLDELSGTLAPFSLVIKEVALNSVYSRIVVNKDGTLNVQNLLTKEASAAAPVPAAPPPSTPVSTPVSGSPPPAAAEQKQVKIGAVTIQEGTLSFSDRHLKSGFNTTFYNLGGRVSGLSSEESRYADVDLRGNLENHSPLRITGTVNPLRGDLFVDLKVSFTDIELSPMTPYSGTYLGYTVDKGKLFLDLKYRIDKKQLISENKVFIDQFTFGEKVESDKATNLPVRLAVALLKDRKGEINLDLPVAGRTDDPQFSAWRVVLQMLKNLLVKAATAPFALLQAAFGGKEDFSNVTFAYGSAQLAPAEQDKLAKLAKVLQDRPGINLEIAGFVDKGRDAEGYRNELLEKKLKAEKFMRLVKAKESLSGQTPENVAVLPAEYPALLEAVYGKEKFPKPRTALGFVKKLPADEMKKLIITHIAVGDEQLQALAQERAVAVKGFLLEKGSLDPGRLFQKSADIYKAAEKEGQSGSRVEFGVIVK